jgi:transglycosylase-like protein with SLT domain
MASKAQIIDYIKRIAQQMGVPEEIALAVAQFESGFNENAVSSAGAIGVMQLMPGTAAGLHVNPHHWRENIQGGIRYLRIQYHSFHNWIDAYAAYNGGPGNVNASEPQQNARTVLQIARNQYGFHGGGVTGGSGGGAGGGAGGSTAPTELGGAVSRQDLNDVLRGFGLQPAKFGDLIERAVRENWSDTHFLAMIYASDSFQKAFPGLVRDDGSLRMTPVEYLSLEDEYRDIAANYGVKLSRQRVGMLVSGDVSPDEWVNRATILQATHDSTALREAFNEVLGRKGQKRLDEMGWFNFLAGKAESDVYDLWEQASFGRAGMDISREGAARIGQAGEFTDVNALIGQVRAVQDIIAPELSAAGITSEDIAVLESEGEDLKQTRPKLEQILRNREALVGQAMTIGSTQAAGGGMFPALAEGF